MLADVPQLMTCLPIMSGGFFFCSQCCQYNEILCNYHTSYGFS